MSFLMYQDYSVQNQRDLSLRAAERYELQRALREADERARAERNAQRQHRVRRYARVVLGRFA